MSLGYIFAIITIILFGSWVLATKTLKISPLTQAFWLTVGHLLLSLVIFLFTFQTIPLFEFILSFIAGVLWGIGIFSGYVAIRHLGIARAMGIWVPVVIIVSTLWGLIFFGEAMKLGVDKTLLTILGVIVLIIATVTIIFSMKGEEKVNKKFMKLGIIAALTLGFFHGSYFVPLHASQLSIFVTFVPLSIGMVLATGLLAMIQKQKFIYDKVSTARMLLAGLLLGTANYTALLTIQYIGVSQGYPLVQLGIVVNTLWGIFLFKEITTTKSKILIVIGIAVSLLGVIILSHAKS
jgi:glucose uptake protein GlcU